MLKWWSRWSWQAPVHSMYYSLCILSHHQTKSCLSLITVFIYIMWWTMIDLYQKNFHQKFSMFRTKTKHVIILFRLNISFQTLKLDGAFDQLTRRASTVLACLVSWRATELAWKSIAKPVNRSCSVYWQCWSCWIAATTLYVMNLQCFLPFLFSSPCLLCLVDLPEVTGTHRKFRSIVSSLIGMVEIKGC